MKEGGNHPLHEGRNTMQDTNRETFDSTTLLFADPLPSSPEPGPQSEDDNGTSDGPPAEG
jgi:hypothetical protein